MMMTNTKVDAKGEYYNLRWNSYTSNLVEVVTEHQHFESLVDVTLACGGHFIKAHKLILSACSSFFREAFKVHNIPHPLLVFNGVNFENLKQVIEFMYCGEIKVLDSDLADVLALGENFQVKGLSSIKLKAVDKVEKPLKVESNYQEIDPIRITIPVQVEQSMPNISVPKEENAGQHSTTNQHSKPDQAEYIVVDDVKELESSPESTKKRRRFTKPEKVSPNSSPVSKNREEYDHSYFDYDEIKHKKIKKKRVNKNVKIEKISYGDSTNTAIYTVDVGEKIPRPPNAFMLFANVWRKKVAIENPEESNKNISIRLGNMWKALTPETKATYYESAKKANDEHKIKYPGYYYSPMEARIRKAASNLGRGKPVDTLKLVKLVMNEGEEQEASISGIKIDVEEETTGNISIDENKDTVTPPNNADEINQPVQSDVEEITEINLGDVENSSETVQSDEDMSDTLQIDEDSNDALTIIE